MEFLTQNKKIAISAVAIFMVSFTAVLFFFGQPGNDVSVTSTDVLSHDGGEHGEDSEHAEEGHEEEEDHGSSYAEYLEDAETPHFATDAEGKFTYVSHGFCELLSAVCDALADALLFDYVNSKDLAELVSNHSKLAFEKEGLDGSGPYRMLQGDREILVMFDITPILDEEEEEVVEILYSVKDITEQAEEFAETAPEEEEEVEEEEAPGGVLQYLYPRIEEMAGEEIMVVFDKIGYVESGH